MGEERRWCWGCEHPGAGVPLVCVVQDVAELHVKRAHAPIHEKSVMLQFLYARDGFAVLEHAVAITVVDKSREKLAIAQLVLHQPAATKTLGKNCM